MSFTRLCSGAGTKQEFFKVQKNPQRLEQSELSLFLGSSIFTKVRWQPRKMGAKVQRATIILCRSCPMPFKLTDAAIRAAKPRENATS